MELLQGSGVEIQVGTKTPPLSWNGTKSFEKWCLPRNLVSHYSPYLKEICSSNLQESNNRIDLQHYQPVVFGLFVEWMYYGSYESSSSTSISNADAKCWALGHKLRSIEFQNYAMRRLHEQHTRPVFGRPVTCDDVRYAWDNTPPDSKLRKIYLNFVVEHFGSPVKLIGSSTDWDTLLLTHSEIRIPLLNKFRHSTFSPNRVGAIAEYLESNNFASNLPPQPKSEPIRLATDTKTEKAPLFNFNEQPGEKKDSPQKKEPFQFAVRTKNHEGATLKLGWRFGESTGNSPSSSIKTSQPKKDSPPKVDDELVLGHANQCITSIGKSDDVNKSPETRKGEEPAEEEIDNSKKSGLGEAGT
ncbi:hypothetical protein NW762_010797 [Fusarium torreyae]|uniref:BTB domain-containing protein n=1 Tax=Fusarium torreyae TaxID=1237075 RepID=A0A9W8VAH5_9HYPO|nr:hypothetical protein NW762_010797 [Fusarium torreyae]